MNRFKLSLVAIFIIFSVQMFAPLTNLSLAEQDISWADPTLVGLKKSSGPDSGDCSSPYQMINIVDEVEPRRGCVIQGRDIRFGYYSEQSYRVFVVGFINDSRMYRLDIGIGSFSEALYSVSQDSLVVRRFLGGNLSHAGSLMVYKNLSGSIKKSDNFSNNKTYILTKSEPDYIFMSKDNYPWAIEEYDMSLNGDWVALQLRSGGVAVLNVGTLKVQLIHPYYFNYDIGLNPFANFAVSDNGKYVAMMGLNLTLHIFRVDSECGYILGLQYEPKANPCEMISVDTEVYSNLSGRSPRFNSNNSELSFYGTSPIDGGWRTAVIRARGYTPTRLSYMALGDSYSSGEGESNDANYLIGTNELREKCHASRRSYSFLISYNINYDQIKSVACSGATTSDIVGMDGHYWGQGDRLISLIPNKSLVEKENLQSVAKDSFLPGRVHQETFVRDYQPKMITVGIGGNDVGFADKLQACLGPDTCSWAGTIEGREKTAVEMKGLFNKLVTTYQNLQNDSPNSKIYAIGYPRFIEPSGECSALRELLLDSVERRFVDEGVIYLNQIIKAAAKKVGIKYISIADSYGNHKMCGSGPEEAANFIKAGDDIGLPGDWLSWVKLVGQESFHPNALGHQLAAGAILAATNGNIETYDYCNGQVSCPQNVSAPEPSSYWLPGIYHNYPEQKLVDFVSNVAWVDMRYAKMNLRLAKYALMPYSMIDIEINSTPRSLGQCTVADDGSFNTEIDLPEDLEEGYHTVHIYGKSYSGENVDLYQVIGYFKPEAPANEELVAQLPIAKNDTKNQIVSISNNNIQTDEVARVDDGDSMKDSFGVWSGGMFIDNNITSAGHIDQSILSAVTTKKEIITEKSLSEQADDTMRNVIVATVCALFAAMLTAVVVRFNRP